MTLPFVPVPSPLSYFASLVQSDDEFPLLEAAATLAHDDDPALDVQQVLDDVARILARIQALLHQESDALTRLAILNQVFYKDMGFSRNANDFYAPSNSHVHAVIRTRRGIPVSLAVIWLELAQGLGLQAQGISFPGHFLVKVALSEGLIVMNPSTGESLGVDQLAELLAPYRDASDALSPADLDEGETPLGLYLQASPPRDVLARMLRNLKEIHRAQQDWPRLLAVLDRLVILLPDVPSERRDRGLVHAELGQAGPALADLQAYLEAEPLAPEQTALLARMKALASD